MTLRARTLQTSRSHHHFCKRCLAIQARTPINRPTKQIRDNKEAPARVTGDSKIVGVAVLVDVGVRVAVGEGVMVAVGEGVRVAVGVGV
jgi:hypothetical protein